MASAGPAPGSPTVVYFGNLKDGITDDALRAFAARAGRVASVEFSNRRRFAYVAYENVAGANGAVATLNGLDLEGREARVELSKAAEERPARVPRAAAPSGGAATGGARENASIVVIGLPADFQEDLLAKAFAHCGEVVRARVGERLSRVRFTEPSAVEAAIQMTGQALHGLPIAVEKERARLRKPRGPRAEGAAPAAAPAAPRAPRAPRAAAAPRAPRAAPAEAAERTAQPPRRVRVEGLPEGTTADQVKAHFAAVGRITNSKVTGAAGTRAFVTFEDTVAAEKALGLSGSALGGATIDVSLDVPSRRRRAAGGAAAAAAGGAASSAPAESKPSVFVGNLNPDIHTPESLSAAFASIGPVAGVKIGRRGNFGFVSFNSEAHAEAALALHGTTVAGAEINVEKANPPAPRGARRPRAPRDAPAA